MEAQPGFEPGYAKMLDSASTSLSNLARNWPCTGTNHTARILASARSVVVRFWPLTALTVCTGLSQLGKEWTRPTPDQTAAAFTRS